MEDKDYNLMGDHDDNHNHGHKKRGEILHLEKIITKKKRTNKYHKDQDKNWKARTRTRTKMARARTSRKMTRERTRRKMERTRDLMLSGKPGRFSANNSLLPAFSPFSQYLGNKHKKNTWAIRYGWLMICYNHRHHHRRR